MARKIRYTPEGGALFEITCRTIHSRFLFRPTRRFNEILVGVLARARGRRHHRDGSGAPEAIG